MAPQISAEENMKLLYAAFKLSGGKPSNAALATYMGLGVQATWGRSPSYIVDMKLTLSRAWRLSTLMKKLEKEHGDVDVQLLTTGASSPQTPKRKRASKEETSQKKSKTIAKVEDDEDSDVKVEEKSEDGADDGE